LCPNATWNTEGKTFAGGNNDGSNPHGIFVDTNNDVYVSYVDSAQRVSVWSNNSITPTRNISGNIKEPRSLFVTSNGDIYIDNGKSDNINIWTVNNTHISIAMNGVNESCFGLFVDINDTLYCSICEKHKVIKRSLGYNNSSWTNAAGIGSSGQAPNQLDCPHGIFVDDSFNLYVADCNNNRIQHFKLEELNGTAIPTKETLDCPTGVVLDGNSNLYIVDNRNHRIVMIMSNSTGDRCLVGCSKSAGSDSSHLNYPIGISFDSMGNMYVSDTSNNRVQKFLLFTNSCGKCRHFFEERFTIK
jgi:sugar lactone lactonase YvrE